jgi:penicillin V acylase-like amidase (Ntn superfamily)
MPDYRLLAHPTVHMSLTDPSGDSAVIEYLDGQPVIHHGRQYQVMTNSPAFAEQLTLNNYWKTLDGTKVLPGSHQSQDRFVRASYYLDKLPQATDERQQIAGVLSVMRNVSVPWGEPDPEHPNLAPTYWRTVVDHGRLIYYFESALSPSVVWVDLNDVDFAPGSGIRAVSLEGLEGFSLMGRINDAFAPEESISC